MHQVTTMKYILLLIQFFTSSYPGSGHTTLPVLKGVDNTGGYRGGTTDRRDIGGAEYFRNFSSLTQTYKDTIGNYVTCNSLTT